jgi:hypothetical protein
LDNITIVTGLWNIKRDELSEGWSRTFEHYLEKFNQFLDLPYNLIIFGDKEIEEFVFKKRTKEKNDPRYQNIRRIIIDRKSYSEHVLYLLFIFLFFVSNLTLHLT